MNILNAGPQPDLSTSFRRDQTRTFEASFSLDPQETREISFTWIISSITFSPLNVSEERRKLVDGTLELNIWRRMLSTGLKMVVFEVRIAGESMASRDFAFLQVEQSALVASIVGGTEVERSISKPIILDGTASYDPEHEADLNAMFFSWFCFQPKHDGNVSDSLNSLSKNLVYLNMSLDESSRNLSSIMENISSLAGDNPVQIMPKSVFMDHSTHGKTFLDTAKLIRNTTYYILLIVRSDNRVAHSVQAIYILDYALLPIGIR